MFLSSKLKKKTDHPPLAARLFSMAHAERRTSVPSGRTDRVETKKSPSTFPHGDTKPLCKSENH